MPAALPHPYHPIIYVRGFAFNQSEIEETVADPYMGFNIGATKARMMSSGKVQRFYFESPLVRLMRDHDYNDVYVDGEDMLLTRRTDQPIASRSVIIYRYYDEASEDFGTGATPPIEHFARGLNDLIMRLRDKVCSNPLNQTTPDSFRVHLVAHSMGGLVCRAFLQNPKLGQPEARRAVAKVFTYATPHNGIDMRIVRNVPGWLSFGDANNFNRARMAAYLDLPQSDDVSVVTHFPAERIFNLVGTNPRDYTALGGASSWGAGERSDGLVRLANATTHSVAADGSVTHSPRAFIHRSHSGHYGIVNSEEGYQNLTRFLFGNLRADGILDIDAITLPQEVSKQKDAGKSVRASYQFEVAVSIRGCQWQMTRREVRENSAIFRTWDQLFPEGPDNKRSPDRSQSPHLFSVFLDGNKSVKQSGSVSFAVDLKVLVPDYEIDGILFMNRHYEGGYILRELILVEAFPDSTVTGGWRIKYGYQETNPGKPGVEAPVHAIRNGAAIAFDIPIAQKTKPGVTGTLRIEAQSWS
jgi:pimeloyl-ACP methyl ester carboxylesterase